MKEKAIKAANLPIKTADSDNYNKYIITNTQNSKFMPYDSIKIPLYTPVATFTNSTFCPHSVFMCFVWISEQTAIISLYSIN